MKILVCLFGLDDIGALRCYPLGRLQGTQVLLGCSVLAFIGLPCSSHDAFSNLSWSGLVVLLTFTCVTVVDVLGPRYMMLGSKLNALERGG